MLVDRVAKVLCKAVAVEYQGYCPICEDNICTMWETFVNEARAAILEVRKADRGK